MKIKLLHALANAVRKKDYDTVEELTKNHLPRGSGFDTGTKFVRGEPREMVFYTEYHHMNEDGYYTGWTEHRVIVGADLEFEYLIRVTGRNDNDIKPYIMEVFDTALNTEIDAVTLSSLIQKV